MTGDPRQDTFTFMPVSDFHARAALLFYAKRIANENPELSMYLKSWVRKLYEGDSPTARLAQPHELPAWLYEQAGGLVQIESK